MANSKQESQKERMEQLKDTVQYQRVGVAAFGFVVFGAVFYHYVEHLTWLDSFYFTTITLATVGYGDIVPKTDAGKIFTMFYVLVGITIFVVLARLVLGRLVLRRPRDK